MIKKLLLFLIVSSFWLTTSKAQLSKDVFPLSREFYTSGFYLSLGGTYNFSFADENGSFQSSDTTYTYESSAFGKFGYAAEAGLYLTFEKPIIFHFIEGGFSFRKYSGGADHSGVLSKGNLSTNIESENEFDLQSISGLFRAVRADQLGRYTFLSSALGLNANYYYSKEFKRSNSYPDNFEKFPNDLGVQLHAQIGIGIRLTELLLFIPSIETPLLNLYPFDGVDSTFPIFSNRHQPILFHFKFMLLRKNPINCNAPTYEGVPGP